MKLPKERRLRIAREVMAGLVDLQNDGGLSWGARTGLMLLTSWLQSEIMRLEGEVLR